MWEAAQPSSHLACAVARRQSLCTNSGDGGVPVRPEARAADRSAATNPLMDKDLTAAESASVATSMPTHTSRNSSCGHPLASKRANVRRQSLPVPRGPDLPAAAGCSPMPSPCSSSSPPPPSEASRAPLPLEDEAEPGRALGNSRRKKASTSEACASARSRAAQMLMTFRGFSWPSPLLRRVPSSAEHAPSYLVRTPPADSDRNNS
mmetsp:Transcript_18165/g.50525  ORF Transcript_18165/g.50525 Transcript_18165/m.50525 type:complete len:206 (+) Transcript_18165:509-1126(+)